MTKATPSSDGPVSGPAPAPASDPTLEALVPVRSTRRNVVLGGLAVLALVGAWVLQPWVHPRVDTWAGMWFAPELSEPAALTAMRLDLGGPATILGVEDVPGARVAGAWLIESDPVAGPDLTTDGRSLADAIAEAGGDDSTALPVSAPRGETSWLVVLWDVTDCALLTEERPVRVELSGILGTTRTADVGLAPGYDIELLRSAGACT